MRAEVGAAGLKLYCDKCDFLQREVEFLGYMLGREGISMLLEKISTIKDWLTLVDQTQLKSFGSLVF